MSKLHDYNAETSTLFMKEKICFESAWNKVAYYLKKKKIHVDARRNLEAILKE